MITNIRDYFRQVINEVDSDLKEHNEALTSDDIADTVLENTYFIRIGDLASKRIDSTIEGTFSVNIELWKNGYNKPIENYDNAYCKAIDIQALSMKQDRISQTDFIKSVESTGIETNTIDTNDNLYKFTIQFTVRIGYY